MESHTSSFIPGDSRIRGFARTRDDLRLSSRYPLICDAMPRRAAPTRARECKSTVDGRMSKRVGKHESARATERERPQSECKSSSTASDAIERIAFMSRVILALFFLSLSLTVRYSANYRALHPYGYTRVQKVQVTRRTYRWPQAGSAPPPSGASRVEVNFSGFSLGESRSGTFSSICLFPDSFVYHLPRSSRFAIATPI